MKKWILPVSIVCGVIALFLVAVIVSVGTYKPEDEVLGGNDLDGRATPLAFDVQYIRTDWDHEDVEYPAVKILRSVDELNADTSIGALDEYDEAYFEEKILIMVLLEEESGSIRHKVQSVSKSADGTYYVNIDTIAPEACTDDMAMWHILIEPEAGTVIENDSDVTVLIDGVDPHTQPERVLDGRGYANIFLNILDGWEYETEDDGSDFGIAFWPAGQSEGKICVRYCGEAFGVCGTGLQQEKITIGKYEAYKGTYDSNKVWSYIWLIDTPGQYVVMNEGAAVWWDAYGEEAMQILNTLVVGDGFISESEAIAIAKQEATVKYDQTRATYDAETGLWTVSFSKGDTFGGDQYVTVTCEGKVVDIQYGEEGGLWMKKRIWIPIVIAVLLAVLVIPIPTGEYKDGGTREYTALTYKIVDWNRLTGDSIYDKTEVYFFPNNFKSIDRLWNRQIEKEVAVEKSFTATILEINGSSVLVQPVADSGILSSSDKISFDTANLEKIDAVVGSVVQVSYTGGVMESYPARIKATGWKLSDDHTEKCLDIFAAEKPVIYLYPEKEMKVSVNLTLDGRLTCTYPTYNNGWTVTASPDGTLTDAKGQTYYCLYWEGETYVQYDLSNGFCVKGADTATFLEHALDQLSLTRREANEFLVYWLPLMEQNPYNIISFQTDIYTDAAQLEVDPVPDTLIRVFMAWQAADEYVTLPAQELTAHERTGFTVVEWGGAEVK